MMVQRLLEGGAYLSLLEVIRYLYSHILNSIVFIKQMVWQTRFIFPLLIKHVEKIYMCIT